jgi:hypothetical protein
MVKSADLATGEHVKKGAEGYAQNALEISSQR